jgi:hypothetical protein
MAAKLGEKAGGALLKNLMATLIEFARKQF